MVSQPIQETEMKKRINHNHWYHTSRKPYDAFISCIHSFILKLMTNANKHESLCSVSTHTTYASWVRVNQTCQSSIGACADSHMQSSARRVISGYSRCCIWYKTRINNILVRGRQTASIIVYVIIYSCYMSERRGWRRRYVAGAPLNPHLGTSKWAPKRG